MTRDAYDKFAAPARGLFGDNEAEDSRARRAGPTTGASELVDLSLALHHRTEKAILVSVDGDESKSQWLPKSRCEYVIKDSYLQGRKRNGDSIGLPFVVVTLPEALAVEKKLI